MKRVYILAVMAVLFTGCASQVRDQAVADSYAGLEAAASVAPEVAPILSGVKAHVAATTNTPDDKLPTPRKTPEQIVADTPAYQKQGDDTNKAAKERGLFAMLMGGLTVLGMGAAGAWVGLPLIGGLFSKVPWLGKAINGVRSVAANLQWLTAPKDERERDKQVYEIAKAHAGSTAALAQPVANPAPPDKA